ncbi:MAG: lipid A export permease/ATP-binding protein MsbA [Cellvibrio sp.]|nr:lipid A export permease/ATP-binding protein MsbA [Cellvibrio sp.]
MTASVPEKSAWKIYKRLLSYVKPFIGFFAISFFGFVCYAYSNNLFVYLLEDLINVISADNPADRYIIPLQVIGITLLRSFGAFIGVYFMSKIALHVVHQLRVEVFNHMTVLPTYVYDQNTTGHMISLITYNINGVTSAATDAIKIGLREGLTVIFLFAQLLYMDWQLTMVFVAIAPVIGFIVMIVGKRLRRLSKKVQVLVGDLAQITNEMIGGFKVMRSFGGEKYEQERFEKTSHNNLKQNMKIVVTSAANTPLIHLLVALAIAFLIFVALSFMEIDDPAKFVAYMTAAAAIMPAARKLGEVAPIILKGVAAADSVFQMLDTSAEKDQGRYEVDRVSGDIEFRNVSFAYPLQNKLALNTINLHVKSGEVIALVGASGSGKTSLVNLISRFYDVNKGEILIDGVPIEQYRLQNLRQQIALVNQQVTLFNETVTANIAYGSQQDPDMDAIKASADAAYATEFIQTLPEGFATPIGESGGRLSGGQRQRLVIARALFKDAPILILDEATAALDNESEHYIQQALVRVMKGRTTIVIAHRLSTIENADRILVMADGRIVEEGSHQELLEKQGHYTRLYEAKFEV